MRRLMKAHKKINMNNQPNIDNQYNQYNQSPKKNARNTGRKNKRNDVYKLKDAASQLRNINSGEIPSDTMGSYTGTSYDGGPPEQDADDL